MKTRISGTFDSYPLRYSAINISVVIFEYASPDTPPPSPYALAEARARVQARAARQLTDELKRRRLRRNGHVALVTPLATSHATLHTSWGGSRFPGKHVDSHSL